MRIKFIRISLIFVFLLVSACAAEHVKHIKLPVKYDLGDKLEQISEIRDLRLGGGRPPSFLIIEDHDEFLGDSIARRDTFSFSENKKEWIKMDNQSLVLRHGPDEYYLLVLRAPVSNLLSEDTITFVTMLSVIKAKKDLVQIGGLKYGIERIYKIKGNDTLLAIKNRILMADS